MVLVLMRRVYDSFGRVVQSSRRILPARCDASRSNGDQGFEEFGHGDFAGSAEPPSDVGLAHDPAHTFQFFQGMAKLACPDRADAGSPPLTQ